MVAALKGMEEARQTRCGVRVFIGYIQENQKHAILFLIDFQKKKKKHSNEVAWFGEGEKQN